MTLNIIYLNRNGLFYLNHFQIWMIFLRFLQWVHSLSTYAKFSVKLTFLTPWYAHVRVRVRGSEMLVFRKILRTYEMNDPNLYFDFSRIRKSSSQVFFWKGALKNFTIFREKHHLLNEVAGLSLRLYWKRSPSLEFSYDSHEFPQSTFFKEHLRVCATKELLSLCLH